MTKRQSKKRALFASIISMILCIAMLVGSTMAWFTDTVSVSGNKIQSGTLEIALQYESAPGSDEWVDAEGKTLQFLKAAVNDGETGDVLWEPGCTYELPRIKVVNTNKDGKGLALQYSLVVSGAVGSAKLLEVIDFTIDDQALTTVKGTLLPGEATAPITIKGHMDENAGNDYQGLELEGISITVYATQAPYEYDSYSNQYDVNASDTSYYIMDAPDNPEEVFDVYEKHEVYPLNGNGGFAIMAEFAGAPGQIYVARSASSYVPSENDYGDGEGGTPWDPMVIARVEDPNGNLVALYDFSHLTSGSEEAVVIDIPEGEAGIWTIRMMNGQPDDILEIGIKNPVHWGVRGEKLLGSGTTRESYYVYAQDTVEYAYFASDRSDKFALYDLEGNLIAESASTPRTPGAQVDYSFETNALLPDTVYELRLAENFSGTMAVDGIPGLLCSTPEAAMALKGGWVEEDGILYQGALQARAREEIVKLASSSDLTVNINKPDELPAVIENPMAEAQLFGAYGVVSGLSGTINRQVVDPDSPYCGRVFALAEWDATTLGPVNPEYWLDFQSGDYKNILNNEALRLSVSALAAAAATDLQLNYFYQNEAIIKRCALELLYMISVGIDENGLIRHGDLTSKVYPVTDTIFTYGDMFVAYQTIAPLLGCVDESAREVLSEGMMLICDKMGDYRGQGPTNQALFGMKGRLAMYLVTGDERYHEAFKRQYAAILDGVWDYIRYNETGYFSESSGCDGSYEYMDRTQVYWMYNVYKNLENADTALVEKIRNMVEESTEFESLFSVPQPADSTSYVVRANNFCSRTTTAFGGDGGYPSFEMVAHEFPMAARRLLVMGQHQPANGKVTAYSALHPRRISSEEWAMEHIQEFWAEYENYYENRGQQRQGTPDILMTYEAFNSTDPVEACKLPCESDDGYLRENNDGIVALKHKGLYVMSFYKPYGENKVYPNGTTGCYGGGAPTLIWSEGTGTAVVSRQHVKTGSSLKNESQVRSSCIFGNDANGTFFVSGKEKASLEWLEENKSFVISGTTNGKTVSWQYDLTDTGVDITAGLSGDVTGEYWINLPVYVSDNGKTSDVSMTGNTLTFKYGEEVMEYTWDSSLSAEFGDFTSSTAYHCLRIKLPQDTATAKVSVCLK